MRSHTHNKGLGGKKEKRYILLTHSYRYKQTDILSLQNLSEWQHSFDLGKLYSQKRRSRTRSLPLICCAVEPQSKTIHKDHGKPKKNPSRVVRQEYNTESNKLETVSSKFPFTTHAAEDEFRVFARVCGSPVQPPHKNKNVVMMPSESLFVTARTNFANLKKPVRTSECQS